MPKFVDAQLRDPVSRIEHALLISFHTGRLPFCVAFQHSSETLRFPSNIRPCE